MGKSRRGELTLSLSYRDSFNKGSASRTDKDVYSGVNVTIMGMTAIATSPVSYSKVCDTSRPPLRQAATRGADLGRVCLVDFFEHGSERVRFIAELVLEGRPSSIVDGFGKFGFSKTGWGGIADSYPVESPYEVGRKFLGKVPAAVRNLDLDGFGEALLVRALRFIKTFLMLAEKPWGVDLLAIRERNEVLKAEVNSNGGADLTQRGGRDFNWDINIPSAPSVLSERATVFDLASGGEWAGEEKAEFVPVEGYGITTDAERAALKRNPSEVLSSAPSQEWPTFLNTANKVALADLVDGFGRNPQFFASPGGKFHQVKSRRPFSAKTDAGFLSFVAVVPDEANGAGLFFEGGSRRFHTVAVSKNHNKLYQFRGGMRYGGCGRRTKGARG